MPSPAAAASTFPVTETSTVRLKNPLATLRPLVQRAPMYLASQLVPSAATWQDEEPTRPGDSILLVLQGGAS
jgi:hypothetical protein